VLDRAERQSLVPEEARRRVAALPSSLERVERPDAACRLVLQALAPIRRNLRRATSEDAALFSALDRLVAVRLADRISLAEISAHLAITPSTLTRRIKRRYGVTFSGYVARRRLERAKQLLSRSRSSVDAVARKVGFTDGAHLRKQLQRFEGRTPSEVRGNDRATG
jgi:AraC-like DNA-binding protein